MSWGDARIRHRFRNLPCELLPSLTCRDPGVRASPLVLTGSPGDLGWDPKGPPVWLVCWASLEGWPQVREDERCHPRRQ